tara:strand:+ start:5182 stop:5643 length:462 start_codon:yes stop_codon:yes gene_type:complete
MATNNLLQRLDTAALTTGSSVAASNRVQIEKFICSEAGGVAKGDVVAFDTSKTGADRVLFVNKAANVGNGNGLAIGVARSAAALNDMLDVVIAGYAEVSTHGGVASGNILTAAGTSAGTVDGRVAADIAPAFGVTLAARVGAGLVDAWIYKRY